MNKHCYRLVFNKAKGCLVVASEAAATDRHDGGTTPRRRAGDPASPRRFELGILKPLTWCTLLALGLVALPAQAQIAPDRSAPSSQRPHVLESANGTPQVNITTPNARGVSRNAYRQFDVNGRGAILNNARSATQTQIGGWVQGNPNLSAGEARVIVNEINSSNPSRLHGAVEIAGRRAEVVIANPAGIDVDGAGFINAQGVTLTTGQPQFRNGALDGYRVEGGTVRIHGDGLNTGDADYAAILTRAAEIQAGVWAEELEVVAGANRISADRRTIEAIEGDGDTPGVAIDVAHLGGMYAGKITLVANERGVGVNNAGRVVASQQLTVTADGRLENRGELSSGGDLRLAGRSGIDNRGDVHAGGNAAISGNAVNNQGAIRAGADLDVTGRDAITNRTGANLIAGGDARLAATGSAGTILSEQGATLAAGVRDGDPTAQGDLQLTATQGIEANGLNLAAGGFYAEADTITLAGSETQAREIALTARNGNIDVSEAEVAAEQRLAANTTATLDNRDGRLTSGGDMTLHAATLDNASGEILSGGNLHVVTTGTLTNRGTFQAGDTLDLDAGEIDNTASGELSGTTTRLNADQLTNRGLIDGITTRIDATTLNNLGTGRIYGDQLGIQADTLTNDVENDQAAVIGGRERLDIGARRLTNREQALLFSAGDMTIGRRLDANDRATGQATRVDNNSATIEALGDMSISAASLRNTNEHFETELQYTGSETGLFYQPVGWDEKRPADEFDVLGSGAYISLRHKPTEIVIGRPTYMCCENRSVKWNEYNIEQVIYSSLVSNSTPGLIQSGGGLLLKGNDLVNDKSRISAGGVLHAEMDSVIVKEATGQRLVTESGFVRSRGWSHYHSEHGGEIYPFTTDWGVYSNQGMLNDLILPVTEFGGNRNVSGSGTQIGALQPTSVPGSEIPGIGSGGGEPGEIIRTLLPNVRLPSNSLFRVRPNPTATYLVETDPRFTDRRQWMSSDYLLDHLSPDPAATHKRLGDGFYEQRLIREQITELTGQRFLEGYADDQAQYAALMNNAVTFAQEHGLRPGVALSAEQMAQLTSDIVWLVEQKVTLEDGSTTKVLVPQVYTRLREGDLKGDGTLIAGDSLQLDVTGDIVNSGTLAGRELVEISADNLTNLEGRIRGSQVDLETRRDLTNLGGDITASESLSVQAGRDLNLASTAERLAGLYVTDADGQLLAGAGRDLTIRGAAVDSAGSLQLTAGRDLDIASTLDTQSTGYGRATLSRADLDRQATLTAGQDLTLNAGRDLGLTAVDVTAEGNGLIAAGRDLALETLTTGSALSGNRRFQYSRQQEVGTNLAFGNDLTLLAGQDIYARAADVSAAGDLAAIAGRDIEIEAGHSSRHEERRTYRKHTIDSQSRVQGGEFSAGGDLTLSAGNDLSLTASRLQAGDEATLLAGGDVEFLTAQEQDYSLYKEKSSGGLFGSSRTRRDEVSKTRSIGSEVTTGGDLLVASGLDQTYQAARLDSGGDIELRSGGTIHFETASDVHTESHERSKSSFAWQSASGEGFTRETLRQSELVAQGELIIQAAEGLQVDVEQIDRRSVSRTIDAMVAANPDLAWLQEMEERGDIDWRRVKAFHDSWDYEQSGLGGGVAMVVAIVAAATGQYYALAALEGATAAAAVVAAAGATAGSLAGTAAVSLINNGGDLGATLSDTFSSESLRSAAIAAVTAGVTKGVMGDTTNTATGATKLDLSKTGDIARFAGQRATQAAIDAGVRTAIDGGSLSDNLEASLESAVAHVASGVLFNAVGNYSQGRFGNGSPEKIALHALTGGVVAQAMGGDFRTGALAAGANEALVVHLAEVVNQNPGLLVAASQVVGVIAAEMTNGDVNQGAEIAAQGTRYNYLGHQRVDEVKECLSGNTCSSKEEQERMMDEAEQLSQMLDEEMYGLCQLAPTSDSCRTAVNAATQYVAMRDAWAVMNGDVSRSSRNLFDTVYNSEGAEDRIGLYYNTIDNRANFFGASDRYEQNLGAGANWFGGAEFVSRAPLTGLGADGAGSAYSFLAGSLFAGWNADEIYDWRAEAGNALMRGGFDNFRSLYNNPSVDPVAWDIAQLQAEQKILQPIHEKYLSDRLFFTPLSNWSTDSTSVLRWPLSGRQQMPGGVDMLDYESRVEYGCKLLGHDAAQGCRP